MTELFIYQKNCKDCAHYDPESGASGTYGYGQCAKLHTNANHLLQWRYPVSISGVEGYVPGACVRVYADFGCILWEPLTDRAKVTPE